MLQNYLKVALRALLRNRITTVINIAGLALAMGCCLLIALFIRDELSYDRYHTQADRIYRVTRNFLSPDGSVNLHLGHLAPPFGPLLKNDFPEFEQVARTLQVQLLVTQEEGGERLKAFNESQIFFAEPEIFDIFDIAVTQGNGPAGLAKPYHLLLSESAAQRYFGDAPALGKALNINNQGELVVAGVFKDFPDQSHWHPEFLFSFSTLNDSTVYGKRRLETSWGNNAFSTYVLAAEGMNAAAVEAAFPAFVDRRMNVDSDIKPSTWTTLFLQKVTDIHLHSHLDSEIEGNGSITNVYRMGVVAIFIIVIACFNFVNLSTAQASRRAREVGLRKVVGAGRRQLIQQFLSESLLVTAFALILAVVFASLTLPWLNQFTGKELTLDILDNGMAVPMVGVALVIGILSGFYPAFVISGFRPTRVLKGQTGTGRGLAGFRRMLVVTQFAITTVLIAGTLIIFQQLAYTRNAELGYQKDQVLTFRYYAETDAVYESLYNELVGHSQVHDVARSSRVPTGRLLDSQGSAEVRRGDSLVMSEVVIKNISVDHTFFDTYGVPVIAGRNFSKDIRSDDSLAFVLNESAVAMIGMTPEEILATDFEYGGVKGRVVGIVRDFHFESLHEPIVPVAFHLDDGYGAMSIRINGDPSRALAHIRDVWTTLIPSRPFAYNFLSEQYERLYATEQRQGQLFIAFSGLAIAIACLGLFGLATFNTLQRIKEVGIRKVLGASTAHIVGLLSAETLRLVLLANVIAIPAAWLLAEQWLDHFAYRIENNPVVYGVAALVALTVALLTVSSHTFRAARTNPAETLRTE